MPRRRRDPAAQLGRHLCLLPEERRLALPFVIDAGSRVIIAPWPPSRTQPGDEARLDQMLDRLDPAALPAAVCWCWPDRAPEPVENVAPGWLTAWARDRAVYRIEA